MPKELHEQQAKLIGEDIVELPPHDMTSRARKQSSTISGMSTTQPAGEEKLRTAAHEDAIWRQTVKNELKAAREWEPTWGFMRELVEEEKKNRPKRLSSRYERLPPIKPVTNVSQYTSGLPTKLSEKLSRTSGEDPMMSNWFISYDIDHIVKSRLPMDKYMFPATTNSEVGWVWGKSRDDPPPVHECKEDGTKPKFYTLEKFDTGTSEHAKFRKEWAELQKRLLRESIEDS
ncbi:hypothetical protein HDU97_010213 [Phlyctochytrium planicorne]|nr:hypothetical protein HDU97_010213 [Phlyctochytrium planicorne]